MDSATMKGLTRLSMGSKRPSGGLGVPGCTGTLRPSGSRSLMFRTAARAEMNSGGCSSLIVITAASISCSGHGSNAIMVAEAVQSTQDA